MKILRQQLISVLFVCLLPLSVLASNLQVDGLHVMGNGRLCVYADKTDVMQLFGAPYSSPSVMQMRLDGKYAVKSSREAHAAIWHYDVSNDAGNVASIVDFVPSQGCAFVRYFNATRTLTYRIHVNLDGNASVADSLLSVSPMAGKSPFKENYMIYLAADMPFYNNYKATKSYYYQLAARGSVSISMVAQRELVVTVKPGKGYLYVIGAHSSADLKKNASSIGMTSWAKLKSATLKYWLQYYNSQTRFDFSALDASRRAALLKAIDDVSVLIKCQQSEQGGVLAGFYYHLAYVRDQYGVSRALLALGHAAEARKILDFYFGLWSQFGAIHNAQAMGYPGVFHCHENDQTEITGYFVVQAFDYYNKTHDVAYIRHLLPMLEWATSAQRRNIIDGMLPFNGDETYIAGGLIPRSVMFHGSAEATLLFIEGSNRLLKFVKDNALWTADSIAALEKDVVACADNYRSNFFVDGKLYLNNPERENRVVYPATRPGVCLYPGHIAHLPVTYHYKGCLYFCADCMRKDTTGITLPKVERFNIPSANLFPIFINAQLYTPTEKEKLLQQVVDNYRATGHVSAQNRILGYDYGMFLYGLAAFDHPMKKEIFDKMMDLRDATGAWVEYYDNNEAPSGCRCRPWESGINIGAALRYALP
jgi:hypothetical protein